MNGRYSSTIRFLLAALLGVILGGAFIAITTRAIPKMFANIAGAVMQKASEKMSEKVKESGVPDM